MPEAFAVPAAGPRTADADAILIVRRDRITLRRSASGKPLRPEVAIAATRSADQGAVTVTAQGEVVVAWRDFRPGATRRGGNHRVLAARVPRGSSTVTDTVLLTGPGSSAYNPRFVPALSGPVLVWSRRTGPLGAARFAHAAAPTAEPFGLPVSGVGVFAISGAGGAPGVARRVVDALPSRTAIRLTLSTDAGRRFERAVTVPGATGGSLTDPPALGQASRGSGAVAWADSTGRVTASAFDAGQLKPTPASVLAAPVAAPTTPVLTPREEGGGLVAWTETNRQLGRRPHTTPGRLHLRAIDGNGVPLAAAVALGGPGERGAELHLAARGGRGATALWRTPSGALRAQDVNENGLPGRAVTLDRDVAPYSLHTTTRGTALATWSAHGRLRFAARRAEDVRLAQMLDNARYVTHGERRCLWLVGKLSLPVIAAILGTGAIAVRRPRAPARIAARGPHAA